MKFSYNHPSHVKPHSRFTISMPFSYVANVGRMYKMDRASVTLAVGFLNGHVKRLALLGKTGGGTESWAPRMGVDD